MTDSGQLLQFVPFESCIEPTFWHQFTKLKLDVDMLEEKVRTVWGHYSPQYHRILNVDCTSFNKEYSIISNCWKAHGYHFNLNTLDKFKSYDKVNLLNEYGRKLKNCIMSGEAVEFPSLLVTFITITFADLKKYHFYYWFAFPAPAKPLCYLVAPICELSNALTRDQVTCLFESHGKLTFDQQGFFGVFLKESVVSVKTLKESLSQLQKGLAGQEFYWAFVDPCTDMEHPGWLLRNLLFLVYLKCPEIRGETISIICLRKKSTCILIKIKFDVTECSESEEKYIGWETNLRGKFGPRFVDLSSNMNPIKLAEESVDLNLRLMKWRLAPDLDLVMVKAARCLLLGAGTLGCSVARALLAWGVETITFVDNGNVSYSNPVRQSLYTFEDCQKDTCKSEAAAIALKKIFPCVKSEGVKMTISMPGRGVNDVESVSVLEQLVSAHDVVFLLTDSRESRWLPTLLSAKHNKIAITAALGFDSYLVMRHGMANASPRLGCYFCNDVTAPGNIYIGPKYIGFDVIIDSPPPLGDGPQEVRRKSEIFHSDFLWAVPHRKWRVSVNHIKTKSAQDRTLDQQCTVTRPGVSHIAAALAVELMVALLQHPNKGALDTSTATCLGEVPHSIRGFLSSYTQILPSTPAFSQCTACSSKVVAEYEKHGIDFLKEVFMQASYLEDLTGLTELHKATESTEILEFSDDEEM